MGWGCGVATAGSYTCDCQTCSGCSPDREVSVFHDGEQDNSAGDDEESQEQICRKMDKNAQTCETDENCRHEGSQCRAQPIAIKSGQYDYHVPAGDAVSHQCLCENFVTCKWDKVGVTAEEKEEMDDEEGRQDMIEGLASNKTSSYLNFRLRSVELGLELHIPLSPGPGIPTPFSIIAAVMGGWEYSGEIDEKAYKRMYVSFGLGLEARLFPLHLNIAYQGTLSIESSDAYRFQDLWYYFLVD